MKNIALLFLLVLFCAGCKTGMDWVHAGTKIIDCVGEALHEGTTNTVNNVKATIHAL